MEYGKNQCTHLSPRTIRRCIVVPSMGRLVDCGASLQLIGSPTSLGIHQQSHAGEKPVHMSTRNVETFLFVLVHFANVLYSHTVGKYYEGSQCGKSMSSCSFL